MAKQVLDPTLLLQKDDYIRLFEKSNTPKSNGTLLNYILDASTEKTEMVGRIAKKLGLTPFRVNASEGECVQPSVEQWLRGFYDAEFVVTDSFHACVFSIMFNKPFIAIGNIDRGLSRFSSLLSTFNLCDRLITSVPEYDGNGIINWSKVNSLLNKKRHDSMSFLIDNLRY